VVPFVVSGQSDVKVVYSVSLLLPAVVEAVVRLALGEGLTDTELDSGVDEKPVGPTTTTELFPLRLVELVIGAECVWVAMKVVPLVVSGHRLVNVVKLVSSAVAVVSGLVDAEEPVAPTTTELVPLSAVELVTGAECVWVAKYVVPLVVSGQRLVNVV